MEGHARQVSADDAELDARWSALKIQCRCGDCPQRLLVTCRESEQTRIAPRWPDETDADCGGVRAEARRNGDSAHVEEIYEIGVEPEPGIERNGIRKQLAYAVDGRCSGQYERVDLLPHCLSGPRVALQRVESPESLHGGDALARLHDGMHDGVNGTWIALEQRLNHFRSLGNPGPPVQESCSLEQWGH